VLTERYPPAVHVAHLADIPSWTIFNDEREFHVNRLTHPLASKVLVPSFYEMEILRNQGVTDEQKVVWFNGFITCYLKGAPVPDVDPYPSLPGYEEGKPVLLMRPEFEFSVFFDHYEPVLEKVVMALKNKLDINIVVLPRTAAQRERYKGMGAIVPDKSLPGNPIVKADVVLGSAETMLCEAFTLGVPAVSCIYWDMTIPMKVLHEYIPHATKPDEVLRLTTEFIESKKSRDDYGKLSEKIIGEMDNPVDVLGRLLDSEGG
jgi:predicted glycosyltransferase